MENVLWNIDLNLLTNPEAAKDRPCGKMALTNYIMHTVITGIIFLGFGFSMFGKLERHQLYYIVIGIWVLQLILSPLWLKYFKMGPLEWFWRWLIYKQQPELAQHSPLKTENS